MNISIHILGIRGKYRLDVTLLNGIRFLHRQMIVRKNVLIYSSQKPWWRWACRYKTSNWPWSKSKFSKTYTEVLAKYDVKKYINSNLDTTFPWNAP